MSVDQGNSLPQMAQNVTSQVTEGAEHAKQNLLEQGRQQLDDRTTTAGEQLSGFADVARKVASSLREEGNEPHAKAADTMAQKVEQVGSYLKDADSHKLLRDVEDFGRRQPVALAAGGVVLGLLAARFLKASSAQRSSMGSAPSTGYTSWSEQAPDTGLGGMADEVDPYAVGAGTSTGYPSSAGQTTQPRDPLLG
jgi:hypothetical protein